MDDLTAIVEQAEKKRKTRTTKAKEKIEAGAQEAVKPTRAKKVKLPTVTLDMIAPNHILVTTVTQFEQFLQELEADIKAGEPIVIDAETHTYFEKPCPKLDKVIGYNFWTQSGGGKAWYIPWGHTTGEEQLPREYVIERLKPWLEYPGQRFIGHNLPYDAVTTKESCGIWLSKLWFDTGVSAHLLNENDDMKLKHLAKKYLGRDDAKTYTECFGEKTKFSTIPLMIASWYACKDAELTFLLWKFHETCLNKPGLEKIRQLFWEVEMPLVSEVCNMTMAGFHIDVPYLSDVVAPPLVATMERLDKEMRAAFGVGADFNFASPKQLSDLLFNKLRLPNIKKGSTDADVLGKLKSKHLGIQLLLEYKKAATFYNTFVQGILSKVVEGKVYPSFNQLGAKTGRFSSNNPNWQNLPSKDDTIRLAVIPGPKRLILSIDYSQIELRILTGYSRDPAMVLAYELGRDIHSATTANMFGYAYERVRQAEDVDNPTDEDHQIQNKRKGAKAVNFGIIYGESEYGLAAGLNISVEEARIFIQKWFAAYPGAKEWLDRTVMEAYTNGYVETMFGRKRRLYKYLYNAEEGMRKYGERQAMNARVQGTAADMMKVAMIKVAPIARELGCVVIGTVHDELLFDVPENIPDEHVMKLKQVMETAVDIGVPITCDAELMDRWSHRIKKY